MAWRRLWMKAQTQSGELRVYVTTGELNVEGAGCDAVYDPDAHTIEVKWCENENFVRQKLHHELLHVCFLAHSGDVRSQILGSKTQAGQERKEELIVSFLEAVQFDLLVRNGWLRYPKPPRPPTSKSTGGASVGRKLRRT